MRNKYKDSGTDETLSKIKGILSDLGIETDEALYNYGLENFHTCQVTIKGTGIATNGKGVTEAYAAASAYGEFMERLQNDMLYHLSYAEPVNMASGFIYAPDELILTAEQVVDERYDDFRPLIEPAGAALYPGAALDRRQKLVCLRALYNSAYTRHTDRYIYAPYYSVLRKKPVYMPHMVYTFLAGTNGMCAGNTPEEALTQGLSEIIERYTLFRVIDDNITPPDIPREFIQKYPLLYDEILKIESGGPYKVIVKDCSLGEGYPSVMVVMVDADNHSFGVRTGAHPSFEIALERSLTEAFQGFSLQELTSSCAFSFDETPLSKALFNHQNIAVNGKGFFPLSLLDDKFSYRFNGDNWREDMTNRDMARFLTRLILDGGFDLRVRDVSYLGFPAYHAIVPGMSEIVTPSLLLMKGNLITENAVRNMSRIHEATDAELKTFADFLEMFGHKQSSLGLTHILHDAPYRYGNLGYVNHAFFVLGIIYFKTGRLQKAVKIFSGMADHEKDTAAKQYYRCVKDYIEGELHGHNAGTIRHYLTLFYDEELVAGVVEKFSDREGILEHFIPRLTCFDCNGRACAEHCSYKTMESIRLSLKEAYRKNTPDQTEGFAWLTS